MRVVCVVQARLNSTRLPRKVLLPLSGKPLLWRMLERVQRAKSFHHVVVSCPIEDTMEISRAVPLGVLIDPFMGDESDLVARHLQAAEVCKADIVVRCPADNPCVQPEMIDAAVESYLARPQLYVSTMYWPLHDRVYADGLGAEVFSISRLQWLDQHTHGQPNYREHPHLLFQDQHLIDGWEQYTRYANHSETVRLDVNTQADYEFIRDIYNACYPTNPTFGIADILAYLDKKKVTA